MAAEWVPLWGAALAIMVAYWVLAPLWSDPGRRP